MLFPWLQTNNIMKPFGSIVVAFFAMVIYAFYLGYTQDSAHPVTAAIAAVHQNLISTFIVVVLTLTGVQLLLAFIRHSRWYYLLAPKTVVHRGVTYRTLESLRPGRPYERVRDEDRSTVPGQLVFVLRMPKAKGCEPFLVADETRVQGMELGIVYKQRDTAAIEGLPTGNKFFTSYDRGRKEMVLLLANAVTATKKPIKFVPLDEYRLRSSHRAPQTS